MDCSVSGFRAYGCGASHYERSRLGDFSWQRTGLQGIRMLDYGVSNRRSNLISMSGEKLEIGSPSRGILHSYLKTSDIRHHVPCYNDWSKAAHKFGNGANRTTLKPKP